MSDLSPELNLALAVDDDDTADYLDGPDPSLRASLLILDGLFNATSGHAHNGAHQGGALNFHDLSISGNLSIAGSGTFSGPLVAQSTFHGVGAATFDASATMASLHVTGTTQLDGAITSSALTLNGSLSVGTNLTVGGAASITGDVNLANGRATGFFYQRGATAARCWDSTDFTFDINPTASTLVKRDTSGQIQAMGLYLPTASQGGRPTSLLGQGGDNYARWWPMGYSAVRLNWIPNTDLVAAGTSTGQNTWQNIGAAQSFTLTTASSVVQIAAQCAYSAATVGSTGSFGLSVLLDGVTRYLMNIDMTTSPDVVAACAGAISIVRNNLAAGSHTLQLQMMNNSAGANTYACRPVSQPNTESAMLSVVETWV